MKISEMIYNSVSKYVNGSANINGHVGVTTALGCLRRAYFSATRGEPLFLPKINMILFLGRAVHESVESAVLDCYGDEHEIAVEVPIDDGLLKGVADMIIDDTIIEIKTVSTDLPRAVDKNHLMQLQAYLYMTGMDYGKVVYISRADGSIEEFDIKRSKESEKAYEYLRKRAEELLFHLSIGEPPPVERGKCFMCPFYYECFKRPQSQSLI